MDTVLKNILNEILVVYDEDLPNSIKHQKLSKLWTDYYRKSYEFGIQLEEAYDVYLLGENQSFCIDQKPISKEIDFTTLCCAIEHLEKILQTQVGGLSHEEVQVILDFVLKNARKSFGYLGIVVCDNSLNGFCELGQALTIMPLEKLGLQVTKNKAKDAFDYPFQHCFGTVTFPEIRNGQVQFVPYLLDSTYRQFFSTVRCNEGRYYTEEENSYIKTAPDPGYFVQDEAVARQLLADGYIELNAYSAKIYGEAFYRAGLPFEKRNQWKDSNEYYKNIFEKTSDYSIDLRELDGFDLSFPDIHNPIHRSM